VQLLEITTHYILKFKPFPSGASANLKYLEFGKYASSPKTWSHLSFGQLQKAMPHRIDSETHNKA